MLVDDDVVVGDVSSDGIVDAVADVVVAVLVVVVAVLLLPVAMVCGSGTRVVNKSSGA